MRYKHYFSQTEMFTSSVQFGYLCPSGGGQAVQVGLSIHVIFSWTQIGRFGFTDREIGSQIGRFFHGKKYSILVSKIVICSTVDHCKMFYLPAYC